MAGQAKDLVFSVFSFPSMFGPTFFPPKEAAWDFLYLTF